MAAEVLTALGLPSDPTGLGRLRKGDRGKLLVTALLRERTAVAPLDCATA